MTFHCSCGPFPPAVYSVITKSWRNRSTQEKDGTLQNTHAHTPSTSICLSLLPSCVCWGGKILHVWAQGYDHTQNTAHLHFKSSLGTLRGPYKSLWVIAQPGKNIFFSLSPSTIIKNSIQPHTLLPLTYRHVHTPKRKTHLWVLGHKLSEVHFVTKCISLVLYECSLWTPGGL